MMGFEKVIGYDSVKDELRRVADMVKDPEKYERLGAHVPRGILLFGKPGCGKTLLANSFIEECGIPSFTCRKNKADGSFVDEIRETFEKAKALPQAIILADDVCKWANVDEDHRDAEEFICLQTCIDDCAGYNVLVFATCNDMNKMPESLLRSGRFDISLKVDVPSKDDVERIVEHYLQQKEYVETDVDVAEIAALLIGNSCADLENILNQAGIYAGYANREKIGTEDIIKASLRVLFGAEENGRHSSAILKRIAVHEAGHCLANELLNEGSVKIVSCRKHRSSYGGLTYVTREEELMLDPVQYENGIRTALAGKAATELIFGDSDMGCGADIEDAQDQLETLLFDVCAKDFSVVTGRNMFISEWASSLKETLLHTELDRYYREVRKMLQDNRNKLEALVNALIERDTLTKNEIAEVLMNAEKKTA